MPGTSFSNDQGDGVVTADGFVTPSGSGTNAAGVTTSPTQIVAAAGSNSQSGATAVTKSFVIITTVSATTRAVRLPTPATGRVCAVGNSTSTGAKVYPSTGARVGAAATNALASNRVAANRANVYRGVSATKWIVEVSA